MARHAPSRTLRLQYVRLPDAERRLRQVFALLASRPAASATTETYGLITQKEGERDDARGVVCTGLQSRAGAPREH